MRTGTHTGFFFLHKSNKNVIQNQSSAPPNEVEAVPLQNLCGSCVLLCLTMRCWADTRLSHSLSGGMLLSCCISSCWAFPWSRLCRGSCGVPWASALSSFSHDKLSWLMASSPSTTEAKGDVACLEDMTLLRGDERRGALVRTSRRQFATTKIQIIVQIR